MKIIDVFLSKLSNKGFITIDTTFIKIFGLVICIFTLTGCDQHYRYFCHDPGNWNTDRCKAPVCEINKDCPKHILPKQECGPDYLPKGDKK